MPHQIFVIFGPPQVRRFFHAKFDELERVNEAAIDLGDLVLIVRGLTCKSVALGLTPNSRRLAPGGPDLTHN